MAIKISGTTVIDDSRNLVNINSGLGVGIQSAGSAIGYGVTQLNFIGAGNTFKQTGNTVDISISGSGGGGVSTTGIVSCRGIMNSSAITQSLSLENFYGADGSNAAMIGPIIVQGGSTVITVGAGVSFVII